MTHRHSLTLVALLVGAAAVYTVQCGNAAPQGGGNGVNFMVGIKADSNLSAGTTVQSWLGRPVDIVGETITTSGFQWSGSGKPYGGTPAPALNISFPLLSCWNGGDSGGHNDLDQAATGGYDPVYKAMADTLIGLPNQTATIAIGWEQTGNWYCWSVGSSGGKNVTYANYIAAFKRAAKIIRTEFKQAGKPIPLIEFCFAWGQATSPTNYWPGRYDGASNPGGTDIISSDVYQANVAHYNNGDKQPEWPAIQSNIGLASPVTYNLDWMTNYAAQQGVYVGMREFGAGGHGSPGGGGGGPGASCPKSAPGTNDGAFWSDAIGWAKKQGTNFVELIGADDSPGDDIVTPGCNPNEQSAWISGLGGTVFNGSWWKGKAVY